MDLSALKDSLFTITNIFVEYQSNYGNALFERMEPRPTDAFILFLNSTGIYRNQNNEVLYVPNGALVHILRGTIYSVENHCVGSSKV